MKELAPGRTANQTRFQASGPQTPLAEPQAASLRTVVQASRAFGVWHWAGGHRASRPLQPCSELSRLGVIVKEAQEG